MWNLLPSALAFEVEYPVSHVDAIAIARENVGLGTFDLKTRGSPRRDWRLDPLAVTRVDACLGHDLTRERIQPEDRNAAIKERRTAGSEPKQTTSI